MSDTISIYKGDNHRECDIDEAKKSFAQYLQTENLNFLIGCGWSSNVEDGKELAIHINRSLREIQILILPALIPKIGLIIILNLC